MSSTGVLLPPLVQIPLPIRPFGAEGNRYRAFASSLFGWMVRMPMQLFFKMRTFVSVCLMYQYLCAAEFGSQSSLAAAENGKNELYAVTPLTAPGSFTAGVEGPACDAEGNVFAVNFAREQT